MKLKSFLVAGLPVFDAFWSFLKDPLNREVLAWIGGGIVVVIGGIWAVVRFFAKKPDGGDGRSVSVDRGSVAIGRDNHAAISINKPPPAPRAPTAIK